MPKTQKSNRGLERKYASQLWKTKGRKKKGKEGEGRAEPPLSPRCPPAPLDEAPLGTAATRLFPARPRPVVQLAPHFQSHSYCQLGKQALSLGLQLLLGAGHLPSSPGPGGFGLESSQGWGPGSGGGVITLQWPGWGFGFISTLPAVPVPPAAPLRAPWSSSCRFPGSTLGRGKGMISERPRQEAKAGESTSCPPGPGWGQTAP